MPISSSPTLPSNPSPPPASSRPASSDVQPQSWPASRKTSTPWPPDGWTSVGLRVGPELVIPRAPSALTPRITLLFGGSFNPPHRGHLWMVEEAVASLGHHDTWVMPSFVHAEKPDLAPFDTRLLMCRAQFSESDLPITVQDFERDAPKTGETADVVRWLQSRMPERQFILLFGGDLAGQIERWACWPTLRRLAPIFVQPRGPMASAENDHAQAILPSMLSSTLIRNRFKKGERVDEWVAPDVLRLMSDHQLYRAARPAPLKPVFAEAA